MSTANLLNTQPWMVDAACATTGDSGHVRHYADTWHPDMGRSVSVEWQRKRSIEALRVCNGVQVNGRVVAGRCPVREQCLAYALELTKEGRLEGVYGGTVEAERARMMRGAA